MNKNNIPSQVREIESYVDRVFPSFGVNKRQEIIRLLFEISKREKCDFADIIPPMKEEGDRFLQIKTILLKRRFPHPTKEDPQEQIVLPKLEIAAEDEMVIRNQMSIYPKEVFIEESVTRTEIVKRVKKMFPRARYQIIPSYKEFVREEEFNIQEYNHRLDKFFIVRELFDFFEACPCTPKAISCGYHIFNLGVGCGFECAYCFMQSYINSPGIIFPANIEDFLIQFEKSRKHMRIGSGEFTDSLLFDPITEYSPSIVKFFRRHPKSSFEFKTKSDHVQLLTSVKPAENVLVSWSLNPRKIIDSTEFYTASLAQRLKAARKCVEAGYKVGFHFDPIILYEGWEQDYQDVVRQVFEIIPQEAIGYISLGCLRMTVRQKSVIERRFPQNQILDGELIPGFDGKLRYPHHQRIATYQSMIRWIREYSVKVPLYLCMEELSVYKECRMGPCLIDGIDGG